MADADEPVSGGAELLALLRRRLLASFGVEGRPDVRVLSDDQLLVSRNLVRNPSLGRRGKAETYVPGADGYRIHVARRSAEAHAATAALSQRITGPAGRPPDGDARTVRLRVDRDDLCPEWTLTDSRGAIVTVHAVCGSPRVLEEVNAILGEIEAVLLV
ncbi:hypothetical protein [Streptomyces sp. H27-D2]|uniref:hypothetical protein n=1 Tax=Streptomyces sp. H27-D2 TaxID=3046304 RepID=UPI002DBD7CCE|nr:hypothetical protein [Streptomyces sp. H27-D2]MEC4018802.1 hypothetical protein [Streptomyces sp. H27-D2]